MKNLYYFRSFSIAICIALISIDGISNVDYTHKKDIIYGYKDGMALVMDVFTPNGELNKAGIIIVISGGLSSSPSGSHAAGTRAVVQSLLGTGYVVFAVAHSSQPKYTADEIKDDIPRAVRFIRYNAKEFGIYPDKIGIIGYSSGGHISLMTAFAPPKQDLSSEDPIEKESSKIQAVVAYYPSTDLLNFGTKNKTILSHFKSVGYNLDAAFDFHQWDSTLNRFERISDTATQNEYYRRNSPITYVSSDSPPLLLIHGNKDKLVPIQQSEILASKFEDFGVIHKLLVMDGQGHGWKKPLENEINQVLGWFGQHLLKK